GERDRPAAGVQAAPLAVAAGAAAEAAGAAGTALGVVVREGGVGERDRPAAGVQAAPARVLAGAATGDVEAAGSAGAAQRRVRVKDDVVEPEGAAVVEDATALGGG